MKLARAVHTSGSRAILTLLLLTAVTDAPSATAAESATHRSATAPRAGITADANWKEIGPPPREAHSMIYDPVGDRVIVFGGGTNNVWSLPLASISDWHEVATEGTPPLPRTWHSAIYDPLDRRMIVFGGRGPAFSASLNDVWSLSLDGTPTWTQLAPSGSSPMPVSEHIAVYDSKRNRMIVPPGSSLGDQKLWALELGSDPTWVELSATGEPPPRVGGGRVAVYDSRHDQLIEFGASQDSTVWILSFEPELRWQTLRTIGPDPGLYGGPVIYDPIGDRIIAYDTAFESNQINTEVWSLKIGREAIWTKLSPSGTAPPWRQSGRGIYDPVRHRFIIHGGDGEHNATLSDTWSLSLGVGAEQWVELLPGRAAPSFDLAPAVVYDPDLDRMIVIGGYDQKALAALSLSKDIWSQLPESGPRPRSLWHFPTVYDPLRDRIVVFQDVALSGPGRTGIHQLDLRTSPTWSVTEFEGGDPGGIIHYSAIYDPKHDRIIGFGGLAFPVTHELWTVSLAAGYPVWQALSPPGSRPPTRFGHSAIYDPVGERMILFGGQDWDVRYSDVWELNLHDHPIWREITPAETGPGPRENHLAVYDPRGRRMLVFGGLKGSLDEDIRMNDVWALSLDGEAVWQEITPNGHLPEVRRFPRGIYDPVRDRLIVHGGWGISTVALNDTWELAFGRADSLPLPNGQEPTLSVRGVVPNQSDFARLLRNLHSGK